MEASAVEIFQNLAYPVAVSVILFVAMGWFGKKALEIVRKNNEENVKLRDKYIEYLQFANTELVGAIKENSTAFNRFSEVLEKLEKKLKANNEQKE